LIWLWGLGAVLAVLGAVYTAFLFNQARARDLWQTLVISAIHMLVHAIMAGSVVMMLIAPETSVWMVDILIWSIVINLFIMVKEIILHQNTTDTRKAIYLMTKGYYSKYFWGGIVFGNVVPFVMLTASTDSMTLIAGGFVLIGIFLTEFVRIRVPQMIPLS